MATIPPSSTERTINHLSPWFTEHTKYHDWWLWKSRFCHWTGIKMQQD